MMIDRSGDARVGNGESVEGIPVAVPEHEALHRIVVGSQPALELGDGVGSGVVPGPASRRRGDDSDEQLVSSDSGEVGQRSVPLASALQVPPVLVDILEVAEGSSSLTVIPVVVGLGLVVVDGAICLVDDGHKIVESIPSNGGVWNSCSLIDGHVFRGDDDQLSPNSGLELLDGIGYSPWGGIVALNIKIHSIQVVSIDRILDAGDKGVDVGLR